MNRILAASATVAGLLAAFPALGQEGAHDMANMPGMDHSAASSAAPPPAHDMAGMPGMDHSAHDMANMPGMAGMKGMANMPYSGVQGFYPMTRDASGTSWQPDASAHQGVHASVDGWSLMGHAMLNGVFDHQSGPRGDDRTFVAGMVMGMARRDFAGGDVLNLKAMLSPDPLMGPRGYPLLLAAGETADGKTTLVDRQHPHDLFMELSVSYSRRLSIDDAVFVYAGLPGEPAFGPPAFMHRQSGMDSPEAPITHHWLDSTHITFGVVTAGWVHRNWKIEASRFKGREPDQHRWDIESPKLDSTAARISWNPTANWSLQGSWAELISPEALNPTDNERRWSASAIYTVPVGPQGSWATTAAWGRKERSDGVSSDGFLLESAFKPDADWTLFGRAERLKTDELGGPGHAALQTVGKLSLGVIRDFPVARHAKVGVGVLHSFDFVPAGLRPSYGDSPNGTTGFARLVLD
ncbi:MAG TPA: hypothetical protein VL358_11155 [Caulobacteraceae bacterium]|jgi:hypothetical protein|nr:hypothetical protein [Caulobacteraceae bacterium]